MKKLLILLAALSLVACSSNEPKEDMTETAPVVTEVVVEETPAVVEEDIITEKTPAVMEKTPMVEEDVFVEDVPMVDDTPMADEAPTSYTVVEGDTLFKIGSEYNVSWEDLAEENNISNPDLIEVGQVLTIPTK